MIHNTNHRRELEKHPSSALRILLRTPHILFNFAIDSCSLPGKASYSIPQLWLPCRPHLHCSDSGSFGPRGLSGTLSRPQQMSPTSRTPWTPQRSHWPSSSYQNQRLHLARSCCRRGVAQATSPLIGPESSLGPAPKKQHWVKMSQPSRLDQSA